jgi:hypothetical protein
MRFPTGMRPWRLFPPSRGPGVSVAIPPMVPGNPHMVGTRWTTPILDYDTRWRDADQDLGRQRAEGKRTCKNQSNQSSRKHNTLSPIVSYQTTNQSKRQVRPSCSPPDEAMTREPLGHIFTALRVLPVHVRGRAQTSNTSDAGYASTGKTCIEVHCFMRRLSGQNPDKALGSRAKRVGESLNGGNQDVCAGETGGESQWQRQSEGVKQPTGG